MRDMRLSESLAGKVRAAPDAPGCYLMRDGLGRIIYVGKASSLRKRVGSYFRRATLRSGSPKLRSLIHSVRDIEYILTRNETEAILAEGRLIKEYKPRFNVKFRDDKRFLLLRAESSAPFPKFRLCRLRRRDCADYFGPYASSATARAALDFVEKTFGLRKCEPRIPDPQTYKHCINDIVRYCSAPCAGKATAPEYRRKFEEACAFLRGERPACLKDVEQAMQQASGSLDFERAAALRDTLLHLRAAVKRRVRIASTPEMKAAEAEAAAAELRGALRIARDLRNIEAYDVSNISGTYAVAGMVRFSDGAPARNRYRRFRIKTVQGSDDAAMMAEAVRRRFVRLKQEGIPAPPDLVLVDGGSAQARAARRELSLLGLGGIHVAGLAKRYEDLYIPGCRAPVRLPRNSPALRLLQSIRDEAHRFALTYHLALRNRRMRESVLDDIPGIGEKRKKSLLAKFGSVRQLAKATEQQVAAVPGIGPGMASAILRALNGSALQQPVCARILEKQLSGRLR